MKAPESAVANSHSSRRYFLFALCSLASLGLMTAHVKYPDLKIDETTVALLVVAAIPWFLTYIKSAKIAGIEIEMLRSIEQKVDENTESIEAEQRRVNALVVHSMRWHLAEMLKNLGIAIQSSGEFVFRADGTMRDDLVFLLDHGYIESSDPSHYVDANEFAPDTNIAPLLKLTPAGEIFVALRQRLNPPV